VNCGTDCSESVTSGGSVTLTAAPASGSTFTGWSGGGCSGTGTCTTTVVANTTVTATFGQPTTYTADRHPEWNGLGHGHGPRRELRHRLLRVSHERGLRDPHRRSRQRLHLHGLERRGLLRDGYLHHHRRRQHHRHRHVRPTDHLHADRHPEWNGLGHGHRPRCELRHRLLRGQSRAGAP
jgi:hypothetical protein